MRELVIARAIDIASVFGKMKIDGQMYHHKTDAIKALRRFLERLTDEQLLKAFEHICDFLGSGWGTFEINKE